MKRALPVVAGVLLLAAVVLLILAWREIGSLRDEVASLRSLREAEKPSRPAPPLKTSPLSAKAGTAATKSGAEISDKKASAEEKPEEGMDMLMGAGKKEIQQRADSRVALLTERLKLRPEQVAALKKAAAERGESMLAAFERVRNESGRPPDFGVLMDWFSGRIELPVKDVLDASQAGLFSGFEAEERAGRIENLVNMELVELSGEAGIHLTPEQKDQVFARLTEITAAEDAMGDAYYTDDGKFMARIDDSLRRRREAMQSLFDASQMQNYDRTLAADRALIAGMFGGQEEAPPPEK